MLNKDNAFDMFTSEGAPSGKNGQ